MKLLRAFWMQHSCRFPNARSVWHVIQMKGSWVVPDWNPDYGGCRCLLCVADCQILGALFPYSPTSHAGLILPKKPFTWASGYMFMDEIIVCDVWNQFFKEKAHLNCGIKLPTSTWWAGFLNLQTSWQQKHGIVLNDSQQTFWGRCIALLHLLETSNGGLRCGKCSQ